MIGAIMDYHTTDLKENTGMSDVTIYGKPGCRACLSTARKLTKNGIEHDYIDFTQDEEAYEMIKSKGVMAAPYVTSPVGDWSGLDEVKINELVDSYK